MKELKVLYFHPHFTVRGGGTRFVLEIARALKGRGFQPFVLAQQGDEEIIGPYRADLKFVFLSGPLPKNVEHWAEFPLLIKRCEDAVRQVEPDILFLNVFPANWWGLIVKRRFPEIPCVWYCHDANYFIHDWETIRGLSFPLRWLALGANPIARVLDRRLARLAELLIANSNYTADRINTLYGLGAEVIYPGVDVSQFTPNKSRGRHIFTAGHWRRSKRLDVLIDAILILKEENAFGDLKLRVAGEGAELGRLKKMIQSMGLGDDIVFLGAIPERSLIREYGAARLVVYPPVNEPFGLVPVEAMACGTPVVVSSSGGTAETVVPGVTGSHFRGHSSSDLADPCLAMR